MIAGDLIGKRVICNNKIGTIKFVGEVPPHQGIYYGIDWDYPADGKHDGSFNGVKYFDTRHTTSGSFIKENIACFGKKFVDGARDQYEYEDIENSPAFTAAYENMRAQFGIKTLEYVGFDKARRLQGPLEKLRVVNLSLHYINSPGETGEIENVCPCIEDLDLSHNLMTDWEQLCLIGRQLKHLKYLKLNKTRLKMPEKPECFKDDFTELVELVLCKCWYQWDDLVKASVMWPKLQSLKVPNNPISTLDIPLDYFQNICILDLWGCNITDWSEINKLGHLKKLELLNISRNGISEINIPPDEGLFPSLKTLFIADCNIGNWKSVNYLNNLPSLKTLKFRRNPLFKNMEPSLYRYKIIARIAGIKCINGVEVVDTERSSAEYDYIKSVAKEWLNCGNNIAEQERFLQDSPRFKELIEVHGFPEIMKPLDVSLKANLISITLQLASENGGPVEKTFRKKFSRSLLVYKLINIIKRLFNIDSTRPKVICLSSGNPEVKVELDNDLKPLSSYGLSDDDILLVVP